ncbi:MAG: T9SS type A sorting domain-containing protein [Bacteroidetes bacterium]|nr:T9SS type A sorting domain-containing protein [Bacteroidota bacterium]
MKNLLLLAFFCLLFKNLNAQALQQFATGFTRPCDIANCGDDRLFIVEQRGYIWILDKTGFKLPTPFLNIDPIVGSSGNEQGLLGLAFHPDYPNTPYFYVNYTDNSGDTHISRFSVSDTDPNIADPNSELNLFTVDQPYSNHNGGCVKFGPDGYLYIGLGDGGSGGDPQGNGQKLTTFLGKMHRIDVDNGTPYSIPPTNPFVSDPNTLDEIWALGMRNPWRFSFDRLTGDLWIGDVGQDDWEEVDFQPANSTGGENYGWKIMEGTHCYPPSTSNCDMTGLTLPVAEYANAGATGCSMTGGFVYRGFSYPELYGRYLYTDYCSGLLWSLEPDGNGGWTKTQIADFINNQLVSFGENKNGELFLLGNGNGIVYRLTESTEVWGYTLNSQAPTCPGDATGAIQIQFTANTPTPTVTWADGPTGPSRTNLTAGTYTATIVGVNGSIAKEQVTIGAAVSISTLVSDVVCPGGDDGAIGIVVQGSSGPATAVWSDGGTGLERIGLTAGPYSVTVTTSEGCIFNEDFNVVTLLQSPTPTISLVGDTLLTIDASYDSYQWLLNGEIIPNATDSIFTPFTDPNHSDATYSVLVEDEFGCSGISNEIHIEWLSASNISEISAVTVTPNPFQQNLHLKVTVSEPLLLFVSLSDLQGKTLLTDRMAITTTASRDFELGQIPSGTYLLVLKNGKGEWVERVVKL